MHNIPGGIKLEDADSMAIDVLMALGAGPQKRHPAQWLVFSSRL
jgi:hypothetical protein